MTQESTPPQVAREATQTTMDLGNALILVGTFGSGENLQALLRLRNGDITTVSRGDRVAGQTVIAIQEGRVALARNGTTEWLEMPAPSS